MKLAINIGLMVYVFFVAGCESKNNQMPARHLSGKQYEVKETFNVGNNVFVRSLSLDNKNNLLWIGTSVGALKIDLQTSKVLSTYTRKNGLANEYVFASTVDSSGDVWFGTNGGGVSLLSGKKWKTFFPMHGLADYWVYSFADEPGKAMWIGTWAGLSRYDYASNTFETYLKELVNEWIYGLDIDGKGNLWIGTEGGVSRFDGKNWKAWTHRDGLGADNKKNLRFSTNTGLGTRTRHNLSVLDNGQETYNPNYVFSIHATKDGKIWAGTWGGGVSVFDGKHWKNLTTEQGLAGDIVYSMTVTSNDQWFGTNKGLSHFDGKNWNTISKNNGLLDSNVYAVVKDSKGRIWAGTRNGVALIDIKD